jgi:hypothetical protein
MPFQELGVSRPKVGQSIGLGMGVSWDLTGISLAEDQARRVRIVHREGSEVCA